MPVCFLFEAFCRVTDDPALAGPGSQGWVPYSLVHTYEFLSINRKMTERGRIPSGVSSSHFAPGSHADLSA